jgi:membrane-bound lytic murein transglycosylase D
MKHYTLSADARKFKDLKKTGNGEKFVYTIKRGDNLWDIGRTYGISVKQLCNWNGLSKRSILRPGQKLAVWFKSDARGSEGKFIPVVAHKDLANSNASQQQQTEYTVKKGDSLWLISRRFDVSVAQLCEWNRISKGRFLHPGQNLIVMVKAKGA